MDWVTDSGLVVTGGSIVIGGSVVIGGVGSEEWAPLMVMVVVVSMKIGSGMGVVVDGWEVVMGKIGGTEIGTETGVGEGGWQ